MQVNKCRVYKNWFIEIKINQFWWKNTNFTHKKKQVIQIGVNGIKFEKFNSFDATRKRTKITRIKLVNLRFKNLIVFV